MAAQIAAMSGSTGTTSSSARTTSSARFAAARSGLIARRSAADRRVGAEACRLRVLAGVDVAQVGHERGGHGAGEAGEVERAELVPFREDNEGVGALGRGVGIVLPGH